MVGKLSTLLCACAAFATSNAQWTVVQLHPAGATISQAGGVRDGKQVGFAIIGGVNRAMLWSGTAASFVDLSPAGSPTSFARGISSGMQCGFAFGQAALWSGTSGSWVSLAPAGATLSSANAMDGGQQGGYATIGGAPQASLWSGSSGSWVNLHAVGATASIVNDMSGGQQVGYATFFGITQASLWSGSAGSRVSLHPAGATESSAEGVHNGRQSGYATILGLKQACLWSGNIGSWMSLHPTGATQSNAFVIHGEHQGGFAQLTGSRRAALWNGTPKSWVNMHDFLPAEFTSHSEVFGLWRDGSMLYATGAGVSNVTQAYKALMWVSRIVAPASFTPVRGIVTGGNLQSLEDSDDDQLTLRPGIVFSTGQPPVEVRFDATAPSASPNGLTFSVESSASFGNAQQAILLWNYVTESYETVDTRFLSVSDDVAYVTVRTNPERFIQPGTLAVRSAITVRAVGPAFAYPWTARIDKVWWNFPG